MDRQSIIHLCHNIKLDKTYKNVLNYTEQQMLSLCTSNAIATATTYSFIKENRNKIKVDFNYTDCLHANYIAFQNKDYDSKWFFAFIESVEFVSTGTTIIEYTVDAWSTWFNSVTIEPCFVVREHVNDDTLGLHTIPEGLDLGEYKVQDHLADSYNNQLCIVMGMSEDMYNSYALGVNNYNGIPAPVFYYRWDLTDTDITAFTSALQALQQGKTSAIVSMFLAPKWLAPYYQQSRKVDYTQSDPYTQELGISRITNLDGYIPKNKKMLCFPFCYIGLSNALGQYITYRQEDWELNANDEMVVRLYGALTSGCSIRAVPINYLGNGVAWDEAITLGKYPALAWPNDVYTNWLTQNGVNLFGIPINAEQAGTLGGLAQVGAGAYTGDYSMVGSGLKNMWDTMQESYRMSLIPAGVKGSLNSGDVMTSAGANRLHAYRVTIKYEYAEIIDQFLTLFGYKVTTVKRPNITGRKYWNFIQIGESEVIGYGNVPHKEMELINRICKNGVTIWHSHSNIGNYNLNNTILV